MAPGASSSPVASTPIPRTRLIGRADEILAAREWLLEEAVPLLTLAGPGGVGKTRLALEIAGNVAESFADSIAWVDLSALTDPALVPHAVAAALGVIPAADRPVERAIADHLRARQLLLLLDNCEHLLAATAKLTAGILASCPAVQILATSRARLRVRGEQILPVEPLPLPKEVESSLDAVAQSEAVRLFVERARAARPDFSLTAVNAAAVAALCRQLDGLPLAIELAAARVGSFPPETLLSLMASRLPLLSDGPRDLPPRQQTVRDTIAWSYDLLAPEAQTLFRRLAVFLGGFTLDAVAAVWPPEPGRSGEPETEALSLFGSLIDLHLVRRDPSSADAEPRYTLLETVREFGLERLAAAEEEADARTRHAHYFWMLVDTVNAKVAPHLPEAATVLARLDREHPNLRAALAWFAANGTTEELVSMAGWLTAFWLHFGYTWEARDWLERAVSTVGETSAAARVWALVGMYGMSFTHPDEEGRGKALLREAMAVARASGDPLSIALATEWGSVVADSQGNLDEAETLLYESRAAFSSLPPAPWIARNLTHIDWGLSYVALLRADFAVAEARSRAVVDQQRRFVDAQGIPYSYSSRPQTWLGHIALIRDDPAQAFAWYHDALQGAAAAREIYGIVNALSGLAGTLATVGRWAEAARLFGAVEAISERANISFEATVFAFQRAIGLPEPWQGGTRYAFTETLWESVRTQFPRSLPPIPDPEAAARFWAEGRAMAREEAIAEALAVRLDGPSPPRTSKAASALPTPDRFQLTPREREVLALLCQRLSDAEIGAALSVSPRTASSHVAHIYDKLGVSSRREAAALAARHHLV
jgi:predicted ATPase/DNA-binding CsgD family transcriptional regulator